ncbi:MAG: response regulator transcription factor [Methylophaga sp.]|nr:response regulator transcription factor [Methylophaga sp.]
MKPTLLIVEDSKATRERLENAITEGDLYELVASVGTFEEAKTALHDLAPEILLTDIGLPDGNGIDLIHMLKSPRVKTSLAIVITVFGDAEHVITALKAGASGYILKDDDFMGINNAITCMVNGGSPISPTIARYLLTELSISTQAESGDKQGDLSAREHEILLLVSKGYTSKEIGEILELSFHTINGYVKNLYKKLSVNSRTEAIYEATRKGII